MLTPDQMLLALAIVCGTAVLAVLFAKYFKPRHVREREAALSKEQAAALRKAVAAGTHDEQRHPLCRICGKNGAPETRATDPGVYVGRSEGLWAWITERLGAPQRLSVQRKVFDEHEFCRVHAELAVSEARATILAYEQRRRDQRAQEDLELARFENVGLYEVLRSRVEQHERDVKRSSRKAPAEVVALPRTGSS